MDTGQYYAPSTGVHAHEDFIWNQGSGLLCPTMTC